MGIHQPAYLPWLGYFDRLRSVDLFVYLDTVQYQIRSFQSRNKVLTRSGPVWLSVPVETKGKRHSGILRDLRIADDHRWQSKHLSTLRMNYSNAPLFREVFPRLEPFYLRPWVTLSDLCWEMLAEFNRILGIDTKVVRASTMPAVEGRKSDLILNLCREAGATRYLSGSLGRDYLEVDRFLDAGIEVEFQDFVPEPYPQQSEEFVPALGVVDYLFNVPDPGSAFARKAPGTA